MSRLQFFESRKEPGVGVGFMGGCCQTPFKKRADMHLLGRWGLRNKLDQN